MIGAAALVVIIVTLVLQAKKKNKRWGTISLNCLMGQWKMSLHDVVFVVVVSETAGMDPSLKMWTFEPEEPPPLKQIQMVQLNLKALAKGPFQINSVQLLFCCSEILLHQLLFLYT